jgi:hypothetical protein
MFISNYIAWGCLGGIQKSIHSVKAEFKVYQEIHSTLESSVVNVYGTHL